MSRRIALIALLIVALGSLVVPAASAAPVVRANANCSDFSNQADAQAFFIAAGGPTYDPDGLDRDHDGIACESLPCPCSFSSPAPSPAPPASDPVTTPVAAPVHHLGKTTRQWVRVVRVIDGDTVRVLFASGARSTVRLLGVASPTLSPPACGGTQAAQSLRRLLPHASRVLIVSDPNQPSRDHSGHLLRYVQRNGRLDVDLLQLQNGNAQVRAYDARSFARAAHYEQAQSVAQAQLVGLWGHC